MSRSIPSPAPAAPARPGTADSWLTSGSLLRAAWRLSLPMTGGVLLQNLLSLVDMMFVAWLGPVAIAAVAVSGVLLGIISMLAIGVTTGCTALVAQAVGAGNREGAQRAAAQSLLLSGALSVAVAAAGLPLAGPLLRMLGAQPDVVARGVPYLRIVAGCSFTMVLSFTFASAVRGAGDAVTPLKVMIVANVINIFLDPVLIYGLYGMPALGVAGSALASVLASFVAMGLLARVFFAGRHRHFHLRLHHLRPHWPTIARILRIGVFGSGQMLIRNISAVGMVRIVAPFGAVALAAYGVGMRLWFAVLMPGIGFGTAAATLVGQNVGARKPRRAVKAGWAIAGMWAAVSAALSVGFLVWAERMIAVFNSSPEVVATGASFLRWTAATFVFTAMSVVLGRAMTGAGDTFWPMLITGVAMLACRIPLAYALAAAWGEVSGVWAAMAASNVVQGVLFTAAFLWGRWQRIGQRLAESYARPVRAAR